MVGKHSRRAEIPKARNVWQGNAVDFLPARCPKCGGSSRILHGPVKDDPARKRYHQCRRCGIRFRSVEVRR